MWHPVQFHPEDGIVSIGGSLSCNTHDEGRGMKRLACSAGEFNHRPRRHRAGRADDGARALTGLARPSRKQDEFSPRAARLAALCRFLDLLERVGAGHRYYQDAFVGEPGEFIHLFIADFGGDSHT